MIHDEFEIFIKNSVPRTFFLVKREKGYKCAYFLFQENGDLELIIPVVLWLSAYNIEPFFPFVPIKEKPNIQAEEVTLINEAQLRVLTELVKEAAGKPKMTYGVFLSGMSQGEVSGSLDACSTNFSIELESREPEGLYQIILQVANLLEIIEGGKLRFVTNIGCEL